MSAPAVRGWCPGAHRPMMSGDGLVVRVRPRLARVSAAQVLGLCDLAQRYGSGVLDLTNRANIQIRGVAEADHEPLLQHLAALSLLDVDPGVESRRNILVQPFWQAGDLTERLTLGLLDLLPDLPALPAKVGFAVDTGPAPLLSEASADFRLERSASGLILRADGSPLGRPVTEAEALPALAEMAQWFDARRSPERRRMVQVVADHALPQGWAAEAPLAAAATPQPGAHPMGALLGAAFGQIDAAELAQLITQDTALRVTPWRLILLEGAALPSAGSLITTPGDPLLHVDACPGAPLCPQATVETRDLARALAGSRPGSLHVSGCAKGCARARPAETTLVGRDGTFDLVIDGKASDLPRQTGLTPATLRTGAF
ncbi:cobalamin biosynthesis protein CobG [Oceanicola sp. S124]|uniref:cobalamin biosynthesis protein CobG n=1 Tax=Oceanicola sp. S124 TaxID=1042378 RepID=UPI00030B0ED2|nr:cobalamin biosynthesis protein CobG [Oceanicola sp. S124]